MGLDELSGRGRFASSTVTDPLGVLVLVSE